MSDLITSAQPRVAVATLGADAKQSVTKIRSALEAGLSRVARQMPQASTNWRLGAVDECQINSHTGQLLLPLYGWHVSSIATLSALATKYIGTSIDFTQQHGADATRWLVAVDMAQFADVRHPWQATLRRIGSIVLAALFLALALWFYKERK